MENHEEEEIKTKFIRKVYQMIYEYKFEDLINLIKLNYTTFANRNQNIIYILMKLNFIKIILIKQDFTSAKEYYSNHLLQMMKIIYGSKSDTFYKKNYNYQCFLNQICTSQTKFLYIFNHFKFETHLDKFMNLIEKKFNQQQALERNPVIFNVIKSKPTQNKAINEINQINTINNSNGKIRFKTEHVNMLIYSSENMSEIEDELLKLNLNERKKNIFNVQNTSINKNIINNDNRILENEIESNLMDNFNNSEEYNNISDTSNYNTSIYNELNRNKINIKKFEEKREIQSINNNTQKFSLNNKIRRVNLCKKIVRRFKKYLKKNIKEITYSFWTSFCRENYLPPFKLEEVEFKSFSQLYLNWLFSHHGGIELYNQFISNSGTEELNKIYLNYNVKDPDDQLSIKNFFINFPMYFTNLKINETRNNSDTGNNEDNINNIQNNKDLFSQPDFATNLFGKFNNKLSDEDEELSIGSLKDFNNEKRIYNNNINDKNKELFNNNNLEDKDVNKMIESSDSMEGSLDNMNRNNNIDTY